MTAMLASVRSLDEARLAMAGGADWIDLKEPSRGALGALDHAAVRICVQAIRGQCPLSATIGDDPEMNPARIVDAVDRMAETGVDYVKIGFFNRPQSIDCALALAGRGLRAKLVAVLFADEAFDSGLLDVLGRAGFAGAMLDTARKDGKSLRDWRTADELRAFVLRARANGMLTGLAGSLKPADIPPLLDHAPDYLGFRGALCKKLQRGLALDARKIAAVRHALHPRAASAAPAGHLPHLSGGHPENSPAALSWSAFPRTWTVKGPDA